MIVKSVKKEQLLILSLLAITISTFFFFGLFHLGKFETTDEHLWKYGRIKQYWKAIENRDWEKTYINDKPGVTVALISGIGLLFEPNPENQYLPIENTSETKLFERYDIEKTERINFLFRFPILFFSALSLLAFFYLTKKAFNDSWLALVTTILIATNPILLGISQIINPDSFFWIFGGLAAFSYLAFLRNETKKMLLTCSILTGFALLSKYTAITLFIFYALALISKILFSEDKQNTLIKLKYLLKKIADLLTILLISLLTFAIFLPAVFVKPAYLFKGISQFINGEKLIFIALFILFIIAISIFGKKHLDNFWKFCKKHNSKVANLSLLFLFTVFVIIIFNTWSGQKLIPFDDLKSAAYSNEPKNFNFKPLLIGDDKTKKEIKIFFMETYPLVFSLSPLVFFAMLLFGFKSLRSNLSYRAKLLVFSVSGFTIIYFVATVFAKIITNVRYSIILYPIFALFLAIAIFEIEKIKNSKVLVKFLLSSALLIWGIILLWSIKPFYFSYANFMLPKQFTIHDSWGHGSYEAAQFLNSQPNPEQIIIWSNSDTVCRFFKGKCLKSRKIDLSKVTPDYFVVSKRGELKISNRFEFKDMPSNQKDSAYYFQKLHNNNVWEIIIDKRPDNFIKIVKFEK